MSRLLAFFKWNRGELCKVLTTVGFLTIIFVGVAFVHARERRAMRVEVYLHNPGTMPYRGIGVDMLCRDHSYDAVAVFWGKESVEHLTDVFFASPLIGTTSTNADPRLILIFPHKTPLVLTMDHQLLKDGKIYSPTSDMLKLGERLELLLEKAASFRCNNEKVYTPVVSFDPEN